MATTQDASIGYGVESTFATFATPTRFPEFTKESLQWDKQVKQGEGIRVGGRVARAGRRVVPTAQGKGNVEVEVCSKGQGSLWQAAMGASTQGLVVAGFYQQVHTFGDVLNSLTIQKGVPRADSGVVDAYSFLGCTVDSFEIDSPNAGIVEAKFSFDVADVATANAYATPSYPAEPVELFHWGQGVIQLGGTVTTAGLNTLASAATPLTANVRSFNIKVDNQISNGRFNYGNSGRKSRQVIGGYRQVKGKISVEYTATALRDLVLSDGNTSIVATFTGSAVTGGNNTFQIVLPCVRLEGDLPEVSDTDVIVMDHEFTVLDNTTQAPMQIVQRTSDTAL